MSKINYIDLGLHRGDEVELFLNAMVGKEVSVYGFEANPELAENVKIRFDSYQNVHIVNVAVSNKNGIERLYLAENDLEGSSIFITKNNVNQEKYFEIPSVKISDWLIENIPNFKTENNVLRMNIEGAELYVIKDLIDSGLYKYIKVFLGSTKNDILKCAEIADQNDDFLTLLKKFKIKIYPYCVANKGMLTNKELSNLVLYGIPPYRLVFKSLKNLIKKSLRNDKSSFGH